MVSAPRYLPYSFSTACAELGGVTGKGTFFTAGKDGFLPRQPTIPNLGGPVNLRDRYLQHFILEEGKKKNLVNEC